MSRITPGEGFFLLDNGEYLQTGDEFFWEKDNRWISIMTPPRTNKMGECMYRHQFRRNDAYLPAYRHDAAKAQLDALKSQLEERRVVVPELPERVEQTRLHNPPESVGNCFQAVLAGLLRIPIESVPTFRESRPWQHAVNAWLRQFGLQWMPLDGNDYPGECLRFGISGTWHEIAGKSPRGSGGHSCAAKDGALEWDPHPSEIGLDGPVWWHGVFIAMRPWEVVGIRPSPPVRWSQGGRS